MALRSSLSDISLAVTLHNLLNKFPLPTFTAGGLGPPASLLQSTNASESGPETALKEVETKTKDNLSSVKGLLLIHPWISPLLDQFSYGTGSLDGMTLALRLVTRLQQPFGALLLQPVSRTRYKRVVADCLIMAQIRKETSLTELIDGIRTTVDIQ